MPNRQLALNERTALYSDKHMFKDLRQLTNYLLLAAVWSVGIACDNRRASAASSNGNSMVVDIAQYTEPWRQERPIQAAFVLQKKDCSGNLGMLDLLRRSRVRDVLSMRVLWYVGPATDTSDIRSSLPEWTKDVPLEPIPMSMILSLRGLGHQSSPMLIILDQEDRVRLVTQSPRTSRESAGLLRVIEHLTWFEDL